MTVRVDSRSKCDITTFPFKFDDWDDKFIKGFDDEWAYKVCTKKEFKTALNAAIKKLREVTK